MNTHVQISLKECHLSQVWKEQWGLWGWEVKCADVEPLKRAAHIKTLGWEGAGLWSNREMPGVARACKHVPFLPPDGITSFQREVLVF